MWGRIQEGICPLIIIWTLNNTSTHWLGGRNSLAPEAEAVVEDSPESTTVGFDSAEINTDAQVKVPEAKEEEPKAEE